MDAAGCTAAKPAQPPTVAHSPGWLLACLIERISAAGQRTESCKVAVSVCKLVHLALSLHGPCSPDTLGRAAQALE